MYKHHERFQDLRVIARSRDKKRGMPRGIGGRGGEFRRPNPKL